MEELKPCPFCGGEAELKYRAKLLGAWAVECGNKLCSLGYKVDDFPNEQDAIAAWNKRTELTCDGCKHDAYPEKDICLMCVRGTFDRYEAKVVE